MSVTPKTMARQITVAREVRAERVRVARVAPRTRLAYSTSSGQSRTARETDEATCEDFQRYGEHVMDEVEADLPGDRSVGFCRCGKYIDTGTFDERN
jgi:hypothetical protein